MDNSSSSASVSFSVTLPADFVRTFFEGQAKVEAAKHGASESGSSDFLSQLLQACLPLIPHLLSGTTSKGTTEPIPKPSVAKNASKPSCSGNCPVAEDTYDYFVQWQDERNKKRAAEGKPLETYEDGIDAIDEFTVWKNERKKKREEDEEFAKLVDKVLDDNILYNDTPAREERIDKSTILSAEAKERCKRFLSDITTKCTKLTSDKVEGTSLLKQMRDAKSVKVEPSTEEKKETPETSSDSASAWMAEIGIKPSTEMTPSELEKECLEFINKLHLVPQFEKWKFERRIKRERSSFFSGALNIAERLVKDAKKRENSDNSQQSTLSLSSDEINIELAECIKQVQGAKSPSEAVSSLGKAKNILEIAESLVGPSLSTQIVKKCDTEGETSVAKLWEKAEGIMSDMGFVKPVEANGIWRSVSDSSSKGTKDCEQLISAMLPHEMREVVLQEVLPPANNEQAK